MTQEEQEQLINELENDIDRLHALYNQYFMGIEKMEPSVVRKNLERKIHLLRREQIKNTALRFRMQMQIQKYNTQCTFWTRVCKQIEAGTYTRQVMLAKKRIDARHPALNSRNPRPVSETDILLSQTLSQSRGDDGFDLDMNSFDTDAASLGIDLDDPFEDTTVGRKPPVKPQAPKPSIPSPSPSMPSIATPPKPAGGVFAPPSLRLKPDVAPPPTGPVAASPSGRPGAAPPPTRQAKAPETAVPAISNDQAQSLYRRYLAARKKCNEPIDNVSFEAVAKSLNAKLKAAGGNVDFKVVIREGKAVIKTVKSGE